MTLARLMVFKTKLLQLQKDQKEEIKCVVEATNDDFLSSTRTAESNDISRNTRLMELGSLMELPKVSNNDDKMPLKFSQTVTRSVSSLKNGGYENELKSSGILEFVLEKLPSELQSR